MCFGVIQKKYFDAVYFDFAIIMKSVIHNTFSLALARVAGLVIIKLWNFSEVFRIVELFRNHKR